MANIFSDAAQSFYSGTFYGELARARKGIGMGLILLLTFIISAMMCANLLADKPLRAAIDQMPEVAATLPTVTVENGKLSIDKPVPYRIGIGHDPESPWVVIDTNYTLSDKTQQYMKENNIVALITANEAILAKNQQRELEIYSFKDSQPITITHEKWVGIGDTIKQWGVAVLILAFFVFFSICMFVLNIVATALTGVTIMVLDLIVGTKLEFAGAMRLAAAARIPINVLPVVPVLFGLPEIAGGAGWVLWGLYVLFAIWAVKLHQAQKT